MRTHTAAHRLARGATIALATAAITGALLCRSAIAFSTAPRLPAGVSSARTSLGGPSSIASSKQFGQTPASIDYGRLQLGQGQSRNQPRQQQRQHQHRRRHQLLHRLRSVVISPTKMSAATIDNVDAAAATAGASFQAQQLQQQLQAQVQKLQLRQQGRPISRADLPSIARRLASVAKREVAMTAGMMQSNVPVTVVLGTVSTIAFGLARSVAVQGPAEWAAIVAKAVAWFFAYGYFFDIGNQLTGVDEDRLNIDVGSLECKANRPLATGEMSMRGGYVRQVLSGVVYAAMSWLMGGTELTMCAALWIVSSVLSNFCGFSEHFATKNYYTMSAGSAAMLLAARAVAGEAVYSAVPPVLAALWIGLSIDCQDFRDEAGDRRSGRRTTAVLWGVRKARQTWAASLALASASLAVCVRNCLAWPDAAMAVFASWLAVRAQSNETPREDHLTYNGICALGFVVFCRSAFWATAF